MGVVADRRDVLRLLIRQGMRYSLMGLGIGLLLGGGITFGARNEILYGVGPFGPATYAIVTLVLLTTAFAATYFPARRATHIDPIRALRYE